MSPSVCLFLKLGFICVTSFPILFFHIQTVIYLSIQVMSCFIAPFFIGEFHFQLSLISKLIYKYEYTFLTTLKKNMIWGPVLYITLFSLISVQANNTVIYIHIYICQPFFQIPLICISSMSVSSNFEYACEISKQEENLL